MIVWKGSLLIHKDRKIGSKSARTVEGYKTPNRLRDLQLSSQTDDHATSTISDAPLELLSIVQTQAIPLYLATGPSLLVESSSSTALNWFTNVILHGNLEHDEINEVQDSDGDAVPWFETRALQSPLGVLAKTTQLPPIEESDRPRVTEVLFYAAKVSVKGGSLPTPPFSSPQSSQEECIDQLDDEERPQRSNICLYALPLSSDLIYEPVLQHLPEPPDQLEDGAGRLVESMYETKRQTQISRKRERLNDIFDTAPDRKQKARRLQAEIISQATVTAPPNVSRSFDGRQIKTEEPLHSPSLSDLQARDRPFAHARKSSRSMSISDARPPSSRGPPELKRSTLSNITTDDLEDLSTEFRNKQTVSKVVMAGMRIYGLQQRKTQADISEGAAQGQDRSDEEYKGVYHQTYKGALFAFRRSVADSLLDAESVRNVVDKLLDVFCNHPP